MNRCLHFPIRRRARALLAVVCVTATMGSSSAFAQTMAVRQFPTAAKRGMLVVTAPPAVQINGAPERLAPGIRIRGVNNMLVMSGALVGRTFVVNYVREKQGGMIQEIWLLNQAEADEKRSGMEPVTNFIFGSSGDQPKTDDGKTPFNQLPKFPKQ